MRFCPEHKAEPLQAALGSLPLSAGSDLPSASSSAAAVHGSPPVLSGPDLPSQRMSSAGLKKRNVEATQETSVKEVAKSQRTASVLLDCLGSMAQQCDLLWGMMKSLPLVDAKPKHFQCLCDIEKTAMRQRNELMRASEAVGELGVDLPMSVNYGSLKLIAVATQQCREIQKAFGGLRTNECMWVKEVDCPSFANCLKDDLSFWKLLLTHRQLEELLESTDLDRTRENKTLSVNLRWLAAGLLPPSVPCAKRNAVKAKQHASVDYGMDTYDLSYGSTLLIRGFEMGFCKEMRTDESNARRLLLQTQFFDKVASEKNVATMVAEVKHGISKCLQHLRTVDTDRRFEDRNTGKWVSENYDVWVWAKADAN
eukprot:s412_g28.t1